MNVEAESAASQQRSRRQLSSLVRSTSVRVQEHAGPEGYAVIKARTVVFKKDELTKKTWIRCDRGGKTEKNSKPTYFTPEHITSSRLAGWC